MWGDSREPLHTRRWVCRRICSMVQLRSYGDVTGNDIPSREHDQRGHTLALTGNSPTIWGKCFRPVSEKPIHRSEETGAGILVGGCRQWARMSGAY